MGQQYDTLKLYKGTPHPHKLLPKITQKVVCVCVCVLTWLLEACVGLRTGEPAGLQSSGKGFGMAGREAGRNCCSSRRHLQAATNAHVRVLPGLQDRRANEKVTNHTKK